MHREDTSLYLLYIEPKLEEKLADPIEDELVQLMEMALSKAKKGGSRYNDTHNNGFIEGRLAFRENTFYKGVHRTQCGEVSNNCDYLLENYMITNSLAPFYLRWYRNSIPDSEMIKLKKLKDFYE